MAKVMRTLLNDYVENSSYGSVCELETQILLAGDLGHIERR